MRKFTPLPFIFILIITNAVGAYGETMNRTHPLDWWYIFDTHFHFANHNIVPASDIYFQFTHTSGTIEQDVNRYCIGSFGKDREYGQSFVQDEYFDYEEIRIKLCLSCKMPKEMKTKDQAVSLKIFLGGPDQKPVDEPLFEETDTLTFHNGQKEIFTFNMGERYLAPNIYVIVVSAPQAKPREIKIYGAKYDSYSAPPPSTNSDYPQRYGETLWTHDAGETWFIASVGLEGGNNLAWQAMSEGWIPDEEGNEYYRSIADQDAQCRALQLVDRNTLLEGKGPIKRVLLISSSRTRVEEHGDYTQCEADARESSPSCYLRDDTESNKLYVEENQADCVGQGLLPYKKFFSTFCGFSVENDQEIVAQYIDRGFPWIGEVLDGKCLKENLFTEDDTLTQNVLDLLDVLGERGIPISINQCLLGFYNEDGRLIVDPFCWVYGYYRIACWQPWEYPEESHFICCDPATNRLVNLLIDAQRRGVTVILNVGNRPFLGILFEEGGNHGKRFWEIMFDQFPNLMIELIYADQSTATCYDTSRVSSLPEDFLDFLVNYSDRFVIGSHIAEGIDYTPDEGIFGDSLVNYKNYWETVFQQVYDYAETAEEGWDAVQNISHLNVERLIPVDPIEGYEYPGE